MGFYFKNRDQQQAFTKTHKSWIGGFSFVTIAYQLFFIAWLSTVIGQPLLLPAVLAIGFVIYLSKAAITYWALAIYFVSIGLFVNYVGSDWPPVDINVKSYWPHAVLPLAIGFILSPYLDITFHRAYKNSKHPKMSFLLGFGVLFLSLLCFVFYYAGALSAVFFSGTIPAQVIYPVVAFLALQTAFTIAAHCGELSIQKYLKPSTMAGVIVAFSVIVGGLLSIAKETTIPWVDLPLEETVYKAFLFFYSLVFPLYLMLGKSKSFFIWTLAICTPAYSVGFLIGGEYSFGLTVGALTVLFAAAYKLKNLEHRANKKTSSPNV